MVCVPIVLVTLILTSALVYRFCPCHGSHYDICKSRPLQYSVHVAESPSRSWSYTQGSCPCEQSLFSHITFADSVDRATSRCLFTTSTRRTTCSSLVDRRRVRRMQPTAYNGMSYHRNNWGCTLVARVFLNSAHSATCFFCECAFYEPIPIDIIAPST